jgi:hypothetical protein
MTLSLEGAANLAGIIGKNMNTMEKVEDDDWDFVIGVNQMDFSTVSAPKFPMLTTAGQLSIHLESPVSPDSGRMRCMLLPNMLLLVLQSVPGRSWGPGRFVAITFARQCLYRPTYVFARS